MTSNLPYSNSNQSINDRLKEIESKKESLTTLELDLKKKINEFRELCLREGEIIGHLPIDYPLQPREPIPQIRSRIHKISNINLDESNSILSIDANKLRQHYKHQQRSEANNEKQQYNKAIRSDTVNNNIPFPSRPTSTNSTSSSLSTASSHTRSVQHQNVALNYLPKLNLLAPSSSSQPPLDNGHSFTDQISTNGMRCSQVSDPYNPSILPTHFKRPFNVISAHDTDSIGYIRASSTASSSSSSGSAASSTLSTSTVPNSKSSHYFPMSLHMRSCSENLASSAMSFPSRNTQPSSLQDTNIRSKTDRSPQDEISLLPPVRPPRGINLVQNGITKLGNNNHNRDSAKQITENRVTELKGAYQLPKEKLESYEPPKPLQNFNINGVEKFQPYYEETKPFQMSDFYKYSSKHRQKLNDVQQVKSKTTKQIQEEISNKNNQKYPPCDGQIQNSVKLIEKSGQKLIEATAKAIAINPSLAEKINSILPNSGDRY